MYVNCLLQWQIHRCSSGSYHYYNHIVLIVKSKRKKSIFIFKDNVSSNLTSVLTFLIQAGLIYCTIMMELYCQF